MEISKKKSTNWKENFFLILGRLEQILKHNLIWCYWLVHRGKFKFFDLCGSWCKKLGEIFKKWEYISPCGLDGRQTYIHRLSTCCVITSWNPLLLLWNTLTYHLWQVIQQNGLRHWTSRFRMTLTTYFQTQTDWERKCFS